MRLINSSVILLYIACERRYIRVAAQGEQSSEVFD